jgi:acetoin utilization protein AcuC
MPDRCPVCLYHGEELARYSFGHGHPFGPDRLDAFWTEVQRQGLDQATCLCDPVMADGEELERFHTRTYVQRVKTQSLSGHGYLDQGDTPAFPGVYEAAATVVGTTLDAVARVMSGECHRAFVPIAGLHHARRGLAAGFCVFNDCGVAIETLLARHGLERVGYVDIDAHHGDGVYYGFEDNPAVIFADLHEDGRYLYPGTGHASEAGTGPAFGTKLNVPMPPLAGDGLFRKRWAEVEAFLRGHAPQIVLFQCGADSIAGDPITDMQYSVAAHRLAAERLCRLADEFCEGRMVAFGGGGYNRRNLATAWSAVVKAFLHAS